MKKVFLVVALVFTALLTQAQAQPVQPLGLTLEEVAYPYPVKYIQLTLQGESLKMAYMDVKPQNSNGKVVMLLHGKNFNGAYWEKTATDLSKHGYRVIIPDQIGFGKSSKPAHLQYSFPLLAQNTKVLLDSLAIRKAAVLGHSMGGMLAVRFTLMYPQLVEKLILENPIGLEDWRQKVPYQGVDAWYKSELKSNYEQIKKYQLENYYDGKWKPDYDRWVNLQAGWTLSPDYPRIAWNSALTYDMIFAEPVVYEFEQLKAPTLLIIGQRDRTALGKNLVDEQTRKTMGNYPELGKSAAKRIPQSALVELNNIGHLPHIEAYDQFITPLVSFLKK
ncbi:alpha/beta hydrolase [Rhodocytophaga aerolata]|uniref:Alpha/beta hydrolase n=1 Tax=Rhodocytophaga aerolata TaxID=455078 RepID=A0ABT8R3R9_9BACT|nr:alpha/beta hydrolase [Rhodocytophaga aerolata]MDO1446746.1 alpha/beta hydrolase [Rhodocytophaga aerolata]